MKTKPMAMTFAERAARQSGTKMYEGSVSPADTLPHVDALVVSCTGPSEFRFGVVVGLGEDRWSKFATIRWQDGSTDNISQCIGHIEAGHPHGTRGIGVYSLSIPMTLKAAAMMVLTAHAEANFNRPL